MRHVAQSLACSPGAMDALARSAARDLAINLVLRLRGDANVSNQAANQADRRLANPVEGRLSR